MIKEERQKNNLKQDEYSKKIIIKTMSVVLIVVMLALTVGTIMLSINITKETDGPVIQAMEAKGDYIKNIVKVEESNEYMEIKQDAEGQKVPVPKGYVGSDVPGENTVKGGYVIYEMTEEEIKSGQEVKITDANKWNEMKTRNQYVWVPVPNVSELYGIDSNGKMWGKLYDFTTDEGTEINPQTGTGVDQKTGAKPYQWKEPNGIINVTSSTSYREPDIVKQRDIPRYFRQYGAKAESALEHLMNLELEFETSIESIAKYGGFYIGRYETGGLKGEAVVRRMDTDLGSQTWYTMYEKCKMLSGVNENVVTSMIFGSQFDRALMWIIESDNEIGKEDVATDSQDWGNYTNVELQYDNDGNGEAERTKSANTSTKIPAGSSEKTKANNIYDLCGNVYDWTIEAYVTNYRVLRGGSCIGESTGLPARYRSSNTPYSSDVNIGCRAALFIR